MQNLPVTVSMTFTSAVKLHYALHYSYSQFSHSCFKQSSNASEKIKSRDAPIRHWMIIGRPIISAYQSADCRLIQKLILLSYLSYLFKLRLLSEDSYLLEGLQSGDKTKTHPKAKL